MKPHFIHLKQELQKLLSPSHCVDDPHELDHYSVDESMGLSPQASLLLFPRSTQEVSQILSLCQKHHVPVVPSGGRTGLAGGAFAGNGEVILSLEKMNHLGAFHPLSQLIDVEAGVVLSDLQERLEPEGLFWPLDLASKGSCQIGGNLSTNAGGLRVIRYGHAKKWVTGLTVVLMGGEVLRLGGHLEKDNAGWDLTQMFLGSEGIFGVITEATLKLAPRIPLTEVFLFSIGSLKEGLKILSQFRRAWPSGVMACEYFTDACLQVVSRRQNVELPFEKKTTGYLLLELEGPLSEALLEETMEEIEAHHLMREGTLAQSSTEKKKLWKYRESITESLRLEGWVHKNDISVPVHQLGPFVEALESKVHQIYPGYQVFLFGHLGDGNLHVNVVGRKDKVAKEEFYKSCAAHDKSLYQLIHEYKGSVAAEHGIGSLKTSALAYSRSPSEINWLKKLKQMWDPQGLLNPGKVLAKPKREN